jgi:para-aminobenzoate synthetase
VQGPDGWRHTGLWTSHEALLLDFEEPLVRWDEESGEWYLLSTHLPWLGYRTNQIDGAHVAFLAGIANPLACKVGPETTVEHLIALCEKLDPTRSPGRLTIVPRLGSDKVRDRLPTLVRAVRDAGHPVVWLCDPMHGNTVVAASGYKTRHVNAVTAEVQGFFEVLQELGEWPGGVHLEYAAEDVTECVDADVTEENLGQAYRTLCDPRLNNDQMSRVTQELAGLVSVTRERKPMRTLLIDNYDSYTYNLAQLIAMVNGAPPTVIANDEVSADDIDLSTFDNVVISPGPGHPARTRDFGISAAILERATIPVLGVCLGHQGIVTLAGGTVDRAPAPRHGHLARVTHDGDQLFANIPSEFTAVRYHSLAAAPDRLPDTIVPTAWAEDGVIMAVRRTDRPQWGVQFHPESVATEYGERLIENFMTITAKLAADKPRYRAHVKVLDFEVNTESAFTVLYSAAPNAFWLDSALKDKALTRFSFLGDSSGPLAELVTYRVDEGAVVVRRGNGAQPRAVTGSVFDYLKAELRRRAVNAPNLPFDFHGGYVGYFGYELKADCGSPNRHKATTPDASWLFADRLVVVDHHEATTYVLALSNGTAESGQAAESWLDGVAASLRTLPQGNETPKTDAVAFDESLIEPTLVRGRDRYLADVAECHRELRAGESYEICLTNKARVPATGNGYEFYRRLRRNNPAPYAAFLRFGLLEVASSSPERFLRVDRDRVVETKPIKGTARRSPDPIKDARLRDELAADAKTQAENLMIVDLLRNDLGRVCETGSVHVPKLMATETYQTVHQLVSTVRGQLRDDIDVLDCVRACFPGGSMTGAPKLRTMEIIDRLETEARGIYSGSIGFLSCNGTADLNIVIRTGVLNDGEWQVGAGGAIVLDSTAIGEYEEMLLKASSTLRAHDGLETVTETLSERKIA